MALIKVWSIHDIDSRNRRSPVDSPVPIEETAKNVDAFEKQVRISIQKNEEARLLSKSLARTRWTR